MSKDIVKSSAEFVYVNEPNRTIRAQVQIGMPLCGLPQWNPTLKVYVKDPNGIPVEDMGFDQSRVITEYFMHTAPNDEWYIDSKLGTGNQDVIPNGFDGTRLIEANQTETGWIVMDGNETVCSIALGNRGNPDDSITQIMFTNFSSCNPVILKDIFIKYSYECDGVSKHIHTVWGMLRFKPDPITMQQVMWFVNS